MAINVELQSRSNFLCELCGNQDDNLQAYAVPPREESFPGSQVVLCTDCFKRIEENNYTEPNHWRFLEGSIWSEVPSVQVLSYKILNNLSDNDWARDALENAVLNEALILWAEAEDTSIAEKVIHKDSYGVVLESGDNVILTQNLNVKGTNYIAPKGTAVKKIRLVHDNAEQIEGKINSDTVVILTKYVRKSS